MAYFIRADKEKASLISMYWGAHVLSTALRNFPACVYGYINPLHVCMCSCSCMGSKSSYTNCVGGVFTQVCIHAFMCVCVQAGRQMWRMTSCSEICGSEYAEQAQASGNCQQYGVRSYLHQVQHRHTHKKWLWSKLLHIQIFSAKTARLVGVRLVLLDYFFCFFSALIHLLFLLKCEFYILDVKYLSL